MARGWTWNEDLEISDEEMDKRSPLLDSLAEQWSALHARMMRPYEHWNEDEGYMQYAERDRY
jgi:hypothetical protein